MASGWGKGGAYMGLVFVAPASMAVCYYVGNLIHKGWGGTVGMMVGFAAGMYETYRQAMLLEKKNDESPKQDNAKQDKADGPGDPQSPKDKL